jgi:hypothetical protein
MESAGVRQQRLGPGRIDDRVTCPHKSLSRSRAQRSH